MFWAWAGPAPQSLTGPWASPAPQALTFIDRAQAGPAPTPHFYWPTLLKPLTSVGWPWASLALPDASILLTGRGQSNPSLLLAGPLPSIGQTLGWSRFFNLGRPSPKAQKMIPAAWTPNKL